MVKKLFSVCMFAIFISFLFNSCGKKDISQLEKKEKFSLPPQDFDLVWSDEFDGNKLDLTKWFYRANGPRRDAINTPDAISIDTVNGTLKISTYLKDDKIYTGMIGSVIQRDQRYGYFECRAKIYPINKSFWPAFWLQSHNYGKTMDPVKDGMEIDIMETFFGDPKFLSHAIHWNGYAEHKQSVGQNTYSETFNADVYHTFALEWLPTGYRFFIDNYMVWELKSTDVPVSDALQYIILSCEVGDKAEFVKLFGNKRVDFVVDYVRVYRWKGTDSLK